MSEIVLILRASKWTMTNEKTGEILQGNTVYYLMSDQVETSSAVGEQAVKASASDEAFAAIKKSKAPAFYSIATRMRPGKDGTVKVSIAQAKHVGPLTFPAQ